MKGPSTPAARDRLLRGLRGDGDQGLPEEEWGEVLDLAGRHGVLPLLHFRLRSRYADLEVPEGVRARLRETYRATGIRNTRLLAQLNGILRLFREARIDAVALKGVHLAEQVYAEVALRPMGDVDLLLRERDLSEATRLLRALGYGGAGAGGRGGREHQEPIDGNLHLEPLRKAGGLLVELHYAITIPERLKDGDVAGLWKRAEAARIGGEEALVLSPEDLLLHLCVHASLHHGFRLSLLHLCDLPEVASRFQDRLDWEVFWSRAHAWGADRAVLVTFALTERLLGWRAPGAGRGGTELPPAPFDVVSLAERLLFEERPAFARSAHLPKLWGDSTLGEKARILIDRAFPSRAEMGFKFGLPPGSARIPLLYPVRVGQLLTRYARPVARALSRDEATVASLGVDVERDRLVTWLGQG